MKKAIQSIFSIALALLMFSSQAIAYTNGAINSEAEIESVVDFDEAEIYSSFNEINDLVAFVNENENVTYDDLKVENNSLIENLNSSAALAMNAQEGDEPPVLSPFLWGCLFSWVGLIVVYLTTDSNKAFTGPAWKGCLLNGGCIALINIAYIVMSSASYATY
ncbi:MAG: hypothetical protein PF541_18110 [Prolixibacteraceae bacterium]|jgi:hypothetical protein|nr:hypothetical protein [Prolixibacteraceae bacterium]